MAANRRPDFQLPLRTRRSRRRIAQAAEERAHRIRLLRLEDRAGCEDLCHCRRKAVRLEREGRHGCARACAAGGGRLARHYARCRRGAEDRRVVRLESVRAGRSPRQTRRAPREGLIFARTLRPLRRKRRAALLRRSRRALRRIRRRSCREAGRRDCRDGRVARRDALPRVRHRGGEAHRRRICRGACGRIGRPEHRRRVVRPLICGGDAERDTARRIGARVVRGAEARGADRGVPPPGRGIRGARQARGARASRGVASARTPRRLPRRMRARDHPPRVREEVAPEADPPAARRGARHGRAPQAVLPDEPLVGRAVSARRGVVRLGRLRRGVADSGVGRDRRHRAREAVRRGGRPEADASDELLPEGRDGRGRRRRERGP